MTYELPAGRGHRYFNSGVGQFVLGGWRASAVVSAVSGTPFSITANSATGGTTQTANQIGAYKVLHHVSGGNISTYPQWFDLAHRLPLPTSRRLQPALTRLRTRSLPLRQHRPQSVPRPRLLLRQPFPLQEFSDLPRITTRDALRCLQRYQHARLRQPFQQHHLGHLRPNHQYPELRSRKCQRCWRAARSSGFGQDHLLTSASAGCQITGILGSGRIV